MTEVSVEKCFTNLEVLSFSLKYVLKVVIPSGYTDLYYLFKFYIHVLLIVYAKKHWDDQAKMSQTAKV